ncbi:MAG: hypothetical protein KIS73_19630 [Enhydrobacter sp.]|nr:hypothetical protein [Enhydrobacter sp.]
MRFVILALAAVAGLSTGVAAQTSGQSPAKTIGKPQQPQVVPSMIVLNASGAKLAGSTLTLEGVSPNAIVFADRPVRAAGHALTADLLAEWGDGAPDSFAKDPPNATVSVLNKATASVADIVVVLKAPRLEGNKLSFDVAVIEGDLGQADGPATIFIDIINLPVIRRTGQRSAWYAVAKQR